MDPRRTPRPASGGPGAAVGWFALAFAGHAAAVGVVEAGPSIGYAHLLPPDRWPAWAAAVLAGQAALVARGAWRRRAAITAWLRGRSWPRVVALAAIFAATAAALSRSVPWYVAEVALATAIRAVSLGAVALGVVSLPRDTGGAVTGRLLGDARERPRPDRFGWALAAWTTATALLLAFAAYERHPHVPDEVGYLLQASYLAEGRLAMEAPPVPEGFDVDLMTIEGDRWYSPMPPGWPAALAVGVRLGAPWIVNPIAAGLVVLLGYLLAWRLYGRPTGRIAAILLALSPWLLFLGMSFMGHPVTLALALGAALATARARADASVAWGLLAGALVGAISVARPLDGVVVAVVLGIWLLVDVRRRALRALPALAFALAGALVGAVQLAYNAALTGSATEFPLTPYFDRIHGPGANALGFGPDRGFGWTGVDAFHGHDPVEAAINAALNAHLLDVELFGWSTGSLVLVAGFLLFARLDRRDAGLLLAIAAVIVTYSFYWFSGGPDFGPRYWSLVLFPCAALAARGLLRLRDALGPRALVGAGVLCASALLVFVPWRAVDKYHGYRGMRPDVRRLAEAHDFGRSLVLVRGERHPDYGSAAVYLPVDPRADAPIYAWDRSAAVRDRLLAAYPDRPVWILEGPTVTGDGYRVAAAPPGAR